MSKFFKALEQAARDRALQEQAERPDSEQVSTEPEAPPPLTPHASRLTPSDDASRPVDIDLDLTDASEPLTPHPSRLTSFKVDRHLVSLLDPTSFEAEQYRGLRHVVEQIRQTAETSVIGVTSAAVGDGKTITAINLAGALAQAPNAKVLLIETDLRRPSLTRYLGIPHGTAKGVVDAILEPEVALESLVTTLSQFGLAVLPAGRPQPTSYELLKSPRLEAVFYEARKQYDYVVVDTPPLIPLPDCRLLLKLVDTLLLVVSAHQTPRKLLEEALNILDPAKVLGIVFNNDDRPLAGYYYRYDYHQNGTKESREGGAAGWLSKLLRRSKADR